MDLLDLNVLMHKFKKLSVEEYSGPETSGLSLSDLAARIAAVKEEARRKKQEAKGPPRYVPPGGWKPQTTKGKLLPGQVERVDSAVKARSSVLIDKYREMAKPRLWDQSSQLNPQMKKEVYRLPGGDTSGHRIFNLSRDDDKTCVRWKPGPIDADLPKPSLELVTDSYRDMLVRHVTSAPIKVQAEYDKMLEKSDALRNAKARIGADLYVLQSCKDNVMMEIEARKQALLPGSLTSSQESAAQAEAPASSSASTKKGKTKGATKKH